jgi:hypothetical protein
MERYRFFVGCISGLSSYILKTETSLSQGIRPEVHTQSMDLPSTISICRSGLVTPPILYLIRDPAISGREVKGFEAGLTNENRWWGPALHYPIVMSSHAPGFWHYFAGTSEPKDIYIGDLEATL